MMVISERCFLGRKMERKLDMNMSNCNDVVPSCWCVKVESGVQTHGGISSGTLTGGNRY